MQFVLQQSDDRNLQIKKRVKNCEPSIKPTTFKKMLRHFRRESEFGIIPEPVRAMDLLCGY
ncbi:MAG TPA: hypothetical protein VFP40_13775, partial [Terriglobales bacterium]|nr:hypothetical protein [Terriglobales bacterium]